MHKALYFLHEMRFGDQLLATSAGKMHFHLNSGGVCNKLHNLSRRSCDVLPEYEWSSE